MGTLFGTDGIRGLANEYPMTAEMAVTCGQGGCHGFQGSQWKTENHYRPGHPVVRTNAGVCDGCRYLLGGR